MLEPQALLGDQRIQIAISHSKSFAVTDNLLCLRMRGTMLRVGLLKENQSIRLPGGTALPSATSINGLSARANISKMQSLL